MRHPCVLVAAAFLAGCSSSRTAPDVSTTPMSTQVGISTGGNVRLTQTAEVVGVSGDVRVSPDSAFKLVRAAYADLQITPSMVEPATRAVTVSNAKIRRRLGGVSLTRYLECGMKDGLPNADSYDIFISMVTSVASPSAGVSRVTTKLTALASDPLHSSQTTCSSTSQLEQRVAALVKEKAGQK